MQAGEGPAALAPANRARDRLVGQTLDTTTASGAPAASKIRRPTSLFDALDRREARMARVLGVGAAGDLIELAEPRVPREPLAKVGESSA